MGGKSCRLRKELSSFFINPSIILVFEGNLQIQVRQKESFHSGNTKDPRGSAAITSLQVFSLRKLP